MILANAPDWPPIGERPQFERHIAWVERMRKLYPETYKYCSTIDVIALRALLRKAWTSPDLGGKEWFVFLLRHFHARIMRRAQAFREDAGGKVVREWQSKKAVLDITLERPEKAARALYTMEENEQAIAAFKDGPPAPSDFESVAFYLQRHLNWARLCRNKECNVTPYFFTRKKNQKFCSDQCSVKALLASKRKWWQENRAKERKQK